MNHLSNTVGPAGKCVGSALNRVEFTEYETTSPWEFYGSSSYGFMPMSLDIVSLRLARVLNAEQPKPYNSVARCAIHALTINICGEVGRLVRLDSLQGQNHPEAALARSVLLYKYNANKHLEQDETRERTSPR